MKYIWALALGLMLTMPLACHAERIFIEGENTSSRNFEGVERFPGVVSGDQVLRLWMNTDPGKEGYAANWKFSVKKAGSYHLLTAIAMPGGTSNFWWRVDGGAYHHVSDDMDGEDSTIFGVSNAMAWQRLGLQKLSAGQHTITIMVNERRKNNEKAYLTYVDALLITDEEITPDGLVTQADVPKLTKRAAVVVVPVKRAGKTGKPIAQGTSIMSFREMRKAKSIGFTMFQTDSDHLATNQTEPGVWDWSVTDAELDRCRQIGVDWQYFPHLHWANEWQKKTSKFVPSTCITHGREIGAMSVWSPYLVGMMDDGYKAMAAHYGSGNDKMKAIYLGVHGDFGETIYPLGMHPSEIPRFGVDGAGHDDWWCGDKYAKHDFRMKMQAKYTTIDALNRAWGTQYQYFMELSYPLPVPKIDSPASRHRWLDFINWYNGSMTRLTEDVASMARKYFPKSLLEIPVGGGDVNVKLGMEHTKYAKIAKKYNTHIRSTHGGYLPMPQNYATMMRLLATSCKYYKVPFWTEPPGSITANGEVGRIFESISSGAYGFWDWGANPTGSPDVFRKYKAYLTQEHPVVDVAVFWPTTDLLLHPEATMPAMLVDGASAIRDVIDYDILDDNLINDGALKGYRVLVLFEGNLVDDTTMQRLTEWVKAGGVVVSCDFGPMATIDGDFSKWYELFGFSKELTVVKGGKAVGNSPLLQYAHNTTVDRTVTGLASTVIPLAKTDEGNAIWANPLGKGYSIYYCGMWEAKLGYYELLRDVVYHLSSLDKHLKNAVEVDTAFDGVYCTLLPSKEVIVYNHNDKAVMKRIGNVTVPMEPASMTSVMLKR